MPRMRKTVPALRKGWCVWRCLHSSPVGKQARWAWQPSDPLLEHRGSTFPSAGHPTRQPPCQCSSLASVRYSSPYTVSVSEAFLVGEPELLFGCRYEEGASRSPEVPLLTWRLFIVHLLFAQILAEQTGVKPAWPVSVRKASSDSALKSRPSSPGWAFTKVFRAMWYCFWHSAY